MYELREYRPGRWAKVDAETGAVLGLASAAEADAHLAQLAAPKAAAHLDGEPVELPLFAAANTDTAPAVPSTVARRNGGNGARAGTNGHGKTPALDAGGARCPTCGAIWPGYQTGFWQHDAAGVLHHWCSGGRPGVWQPAELVGG